MAWKRLQDLDDNAGFGWKALPAYVGLDPYVAWASASRLVEKAGQLPFLIRASAQGEGNLSASRLFLTHQVETRDVTKFVRGVKFDVPSFPRPLPIELDFAATLGLPRLTDTEYRPRAAPSSTPQDPSAAEPLIAIIDDGCAFAHEAYRLNTAEGLPGTRVLFLWDQNETHNGPWRNLAVSGEGYGFELDRNAMNRLMAAARCEHGDGVDEDACYRAAGLQNLVGASFSHGSHMMGLATGSPNPLVEPGCVDGTKHDSACQADIIFVQLPRKTMRDTSGGALAVNVFDALRYIEARATQMNSDGTTVQRPVIVNLSVGAAGGPHDASSLIEQAIDDFVTRRPQCAVMVAAGNARARSMHDCIPLAKGTERTLEWHAPPDSTGEALLELWYPAEDDDGLNTSIAVRLTPPGSSTKPGPWVQPGEAYFLELPQVAAGTNPVIGGVVSARHPSNSASGHMALLALAPTATATLDRPTGAAQALASARALATPGVWKVEVRNQSHSHLTVDAWIERSDGAFGSRARQSDFGDPELVDTPNEATMSSLAQGAATLVIGACDGHEPMRPDRHSGQGPGRMGLGRPGPDMVAPSNEDSALPPGLLAPGVHSGQWNRLGGTSAATAFATRVLFNQWRAQACAIGDWKHIKAHFKPDRPRQPGEPESRVGQGRLEWPAC